MFANSDDETLVHHCLAGDENAFGFLLHKYKDLVHAYVYQKVSNHADAEDITQEVFLRAYRNLAKLKSPHKFRSWLYTITSNECKRWLARNLRRREKEVNLEDASEDAFGFEAGFAQSPTDWQVDLEEALKGLPEDNRIAVSMFYLSDCSLKEIGEYLGVSANTVKGKLHRARQQLGDALSESYGRALSKRRLKGGFIMRIMEQLSHLPRPMIPPAWQGHLLRQIPLALATAACVLMGVLGVFSEEAQDMEMLETSPFVLSEMRQPSSQIVEPAWLVTLPGRTPSMSSQTAAQDKENRGKNEPALAKADALLAAKQYREAAGAYRLLLNSTSSDEIVFSAYYGLGMSLYKWGWPVFRRADDAIIALKMVPENNKYWASAQLLSGRCFLRKAIWTKDNTQKGKHYETAFQAFQDVLRRQTTGDIRKQAEYLRTLCQVKLGKLDSKTPYIRKLLEMARQDEDAAIRFVAADDLDMPIPGMRIVGTITDKLTGQPVENASVSVTGIGNDITDEQGRFSIDNLIGRDDGATLWVDMKGYGKKRVKVMISETESDTQVDVKLGPGATVVGRVVDSEGRPITDAKVDITGDSHRIRLVKIDAEGKYQLADIEVRQNAYRLNAYHPDFISTSPAISVNKTGIIEAPDIVLTRGSTLKGGATVKARGGFSNAKTNANGEYHLKNLPGDSTVVYVLSPDFIPSSRKKVRLDPKEELPPVDFVLQPGKPLVGRVVDEKGEPIENARVELQTWGGGYPGDGRYAMTNANGEFRMEHLPEGEITLRLDKKGYLYMNDQAAEVEPDKPVTTMENPIIMQKGARAYAKVVDAETGKPIRHFKVKAKSPKQLEPGDIRPDGLPGDWHRGFLFQSNTGEFKTFERFRGMVIALEVEAEGYAITYVPRVVFGAYDKEPLIIRMNKQAKRIEGIVVDAEMGKPLIGALITTFGKNNPLFIDGVAPEHRATEPIHTDAQGKFVLQDTLAEEFYIYVTYPERAAAIFGPLSSTTNENPKLIRVEMQKSCAVTGKTDPEKQITLSLSQRNRYLRVNRLTRASREGIYRIENLMPGEYQIQEMIPIDGGARSGRGTAFELEAGETKIINFR